jgi:spore coat protein CotH
VILFVVVSVVRVRAVSVLGVRHVLIVFMSSQVIEILSASHAGVGVVVLRVDVSEGKLLEMTMSQKGWGKVLKVGVENGVASFAPAVDSEDGFVIVVLGSVVVRGQVHVEDGVVELSPAQKTLLSPVNKLQGVNLQMYFGPVQCSPDS